VVAVDSRPLQASLSQIQPVQLRQVRRSAEEGLFNSLIAQYHYLGYSQPVGEHLSRPSRNQKSNTMAAPPKAR
jgi:hypothetical protein